MTLKVFWLIIALHSIFILSAQEKLNYQVRIGAKFSVNQSISYTKQKIPGIKLYATLIGNQQIGNNFFLNLSSSLAFYKKSLGNDWNPLNYDLQIDFTNGVTFAYVNNPLKYQKFLRTVGNSNAYNLMHNYENLVGLSSNFIFNNHNRNQVIGSFLMTINNFSLNVYNDYSLLPIGDNFDRWWTGGGAIFIHNNRSFNIVEVCSDQFTGYSPLIFELTKLLGINTPKYFKTSNNFTPKSYNSSAFNIYIGFNEQVKMGLGMNGSLKFGKKGSERYFGFQDIIHILRNIPLHPNNEVNKLQLSFLYTNNLHEF